MAVHLDFAVLGAVKPRKGAWQAKTTLDKAKPVTLETIRADQCH